MTLPDHAVRPVLAFLLLALPRPEAPAEPIVSGAFWTRVPAVTVVTTTANDPRLPLVRDAVAF
jgi:hypothetical protein